MGNSEVHTLEQLNQVLEKDPDNAEAWKLKGDLLFEKTSFYEARKCYIKSIISDPNYPEGWRGKGLISIFENNILGAIQCFNKTLYLTDNNDVEALRLKFICYGWYQTNKKKMLENLDRIINLKLGSIKTITSKALFLKRKNQLDESLQLFKKGLILDPNNLVCLVNQNKITKKDETKNGTINFLKEKFSFSENGQLKAIADELFLNFDFHSASQCYDHLLQFQPNVHDLLRKKGLLSFMKNNLNEALEFFSKYLEKKPDDSDVWTRKGEILRRQNRIIEANDCFDNAITKDSENEEAWRRKSLTQSMRHKNFDEAIRCLNKSLEIDPYHPKTLVQKAIFLEREKSKWNQAIEWLDKAIEVDPTFVLAWKKKGNLYIYSNDYESAMVCFDNIIKLDPDDVISWYNAGIIQAKFAEMQFQKGKDYFKKSNFEEAKKSFDKTLSVDPKDLKTLKMKGESLLHLNNKTEALLSFKKALELDPENEEMQKKIQNLQL